MANLSYSDVERAMERIEGLIRPVTVFPAEDNIRLAAEFMQHTGTFKARGAANFISAHVESGAMPDAGVMIASGGNAGMACAWAAQHHGIPATVFVPETTPAAKVARLHAYGADVHQVGREYAEALEASHRFAEQTGALPSHAYDDPLIAAGAGTLVPEMLDAVPGGLDTIVVAVGGGGLFAGVATAAEHFGIKAVAVEPEGSRALNAAIEAGQVVDVPVDSVAADALGARRATAMALDVALRQKFPSILVPDSAIVRARQHLWDDRRVVVENAAATALAAVQGGAYEPAPGERVAVVLCGANAAVSF